jgi:hypothetical protein
MPRANTPGMVGNKLWKLSREQVDALAAKHGWLRNKDRGGYAISPVTDVWLITWVMPDV